MQDFTKVVGSKTQTSQKEKAVAGQVVNSEGGYVFEVDDWKKLDRFLILGSEGGTFYASERKTTVDNLEAVKRCLAADGLRVVRRIVEVSDKGLAIKNSPAIVALALACAYGLEKPVPNPIVSTGSAGGVEQARAACVDYDVAKRVRAEAARAIPKVCRIVTHLFEFINIVKGLRGFGRSLREAISAWYLSKTPEQLDYQLAKYKNRIGWTHKDVFRLTHINSKDKPQHAGIMSWAMDKDGAPGRCGHGMDLLGAPDVDAKTVIKAIGEFGLTREMLPTKFLSDPKVMGALLERGMPLTAMIRSLGNLTRLGVIAPLSSAENLVCQRLTDQEYLKRSRVHPFAVLLAAKAYSLGRPVKGNQANTWAPSRRVVAALDQAFSLAFHNVKPTGKRWMLGLDVSGSMASLISGSVISSCEAVAAVALTLLRSGDPMIAYGFCQRLVDLKMHAGMSLLEATRAAQQNNFGSTDCSLPIMWATDAKIPVDVFLIMTDSETYAGGIHPFEAIKKYRSKMGIPAKMIVAAFASNGFSIADPRDAGMLDVVGLSADVPTVMANFATDFQGGTASDSDDEGSDD